MSACTTGVIRCMRPGAGTPDGPVRAHVNQATKGAISETLAEVEVSASSHRQKRSTTPRTGGEGQTYRNACDPCCSASRCGARGEQDAH